MIFEETALAGLWTVRTQPHADERGFFARSFCEDSFRAHGLNARFEQSSISHNDRSGTLRGMHFQNDPHAETKLVRCVKGAVFDVAVDLRRGSPTYLGWFGTTLSDENGLALFIPPGFAHGFVTLVDNADVLYSITPPFAPGFGMGVRWDDPTFAIDWPMTNPILSDRDATYPDWIA